jgi:hypothetical protein
MASLRKKVSKDKVVSLRPKLLVLERSLNAAFGALCWALAKHKLPLLEDNFYLLMFPPMAKDLVGQFLCRVVGQDALYLPATFKWLELK